MIASVILRVAQIFVILTKRQHEQSQSAFRFGKKMIENQGKGSKAVTRKCSAKMLFLKVLQNPLENTCAGVSFLINLQA